MTQAGTQDRPRTGTRAQRMAMPLARSVVRQIAAEHGACLRPVQLRRTDCQRRDRSNRSSSRAGTRSASVCAPCAERAKVLRAAQCREGWHLDHEPVIDPDDAGRLAALAGSRSGPRLRPSATGPGTRRRGRGRAGRAERRAGRGDHPFGRAREGAACPPGPPSPVHPAAAGCAGPAPAQGSGPDGRQDVHGPGRHDVPPVDVRHADLPELRARGQRRHAADPDRYDYGRAARDALHFAALFDRFIQNLRRFLGYDVQYFAAVEPQRRLAPHVHIAMRGTVSRTELRQVLAATYHQVWWPDTSTVALPRRRAAGVARGQRQLPRPGDRGSPADLGRGARCDRPEDEPQHVARFGERFDAQGVLAGSRDANRCIGYLTKYLTKHVADCHQAADTRPARAHRTARRRAPVRAVLPHLRELAALRRPAQERPSGPAAGLLQGQGPPPRIPRVRGPPRPGLAQVVGQDAGRPPRRPPGVADGHARHPGHRPGRYSWEPVSPGDPDHMPPAQRMLHVVADRIRWQEALRRSQAPSRRERAAGSFGNREGA